MSTPKDSHFVPLGTSDSAAYLKGKAGAITAALDAGFDRRAFLEIPVQWGEQDANNHVNNVVFFKYCEAGRMRYTSVLGSLISAEARADWLSKGKGKGVVVGSLSYSYLLPVVAPDTVLVAHRLVSIPNDRKMELEAFIYSFRQQKRVGAGRAILVGYDHSKLRSSAIPAEVIEQARRMDKLPEGEREKTAAKL